MWVFAIIEVSLVEGGALLSCVATACELDDIEVGVSGATVFWAKLPVCVGVIARVDPAMKAARC